MADQVAIARIAPQERIANLDVLRGVAILAILVMNIPFMGGYVLERWDPRVVSWTPADYWTLRLMDSTLEGTQRGLLEMLFGAGIMIMARSAMRPDGPVAVADLHYRRNWLLILLGLFNALVLFWGGDILLPYGITALLLFQFRLLKPRTQIILGAFFLLLAMSEGAYRYSERVHAREAAQQVALATAEHRPVDKALSAKAADWQKA